MRPAVSTRRLPVRAPWYRSPVALRDPRPRSPGANGGRSAELPASSGAGEATMQRKRLRRAALVALIAAAAWLSGSAPFRRDGDRPGAQPAGLRGRRGVAHAAGRHEARRAVQHRRRRGGQRLGPAPPADAAARGRRHGGGAGRRLRCGGQLHQGLGRSGRRLRVAATGARPAHRSRGLRLAGRQQLFHQRPGPGRAGQRRPAAEVHAGRHARHADSAAATRAGATPTR